MIRYPIYKSEDKKYSPFDEYKVEASKVLGLSAIESSIKVLYTNYESAVAAESVHTLKPHGFSGPEKDLLKGLYKRNCKPAKRIREHHNDFTKTTKRIYNNKCPYCVLSEPNTIEHILPKDTYPEYVIHMYNLIPCCSTCNGHKGTSVQDSAGLPHVLNLYYHDPESFQFLEVDCAIDSNGKPSFTYKLAFPTTADPTLEIIITNHYNRLHLLQRYNEEVINSYVPVENMVISMCKGKSLNEALQFLNDYLSRISSEYGLNHHYIALMRCLIDSPVYHNYLATIL